jgi:hypothetical protein
MSLKKVMYRPLGHLNDKNRLPEEKFGFRKNLTTEKATYELINETVSALNGKLISLTHCTIDTCSVCAM